MSQKLSIVTLFVSFVSVLVVVLLAAVVAAVFIDVLTSGVLISSSRSGCPCLLNSPHYRAGVCMYVYIIIHNEGYWFSGYLQSVVPSLQHLL